MNTSFHCNLSLPSEKLVHYWEHTVGSCHATLTLRADWQSQLARARRELGFRHVRFHGLFDDDLGTLVNENNQYVYSFFNANQICDFLLSIDVKPFFELSFMPKALSSSNDTVFHYEGNISPPRDYSEWATLLDQLIRNWVSRYGIEEVKTWFFEIWNEPNLDAFWKGSQADYFKLYAYSSRAIKRIDESLRVGGPATAKNEWIPEFLSYCEKEKVAVDFVSTHHYPTDAFGKPGDDTLSQLAASHRSVLREEAEKAKEQSKGLPLYYTEWSSSSNPFDSLHDEPYCASFILKTCLEGRGLTEGYSYWTFTDIFEENYFSSAPFHGGFGLMNIYGVPKPSYRAFEILHRLGDEIFKVEGSHETVDVWVSRRCQQILVVITNFSLPRHPVKTEAILVSLAGVKKVKSAWIERIDDENANSVKAWKEMGKPDYLRPAQVQALELASRLKREPLEWSDQGSGIEIEVVIPPQGSLLLTIEVSA